VRQRETKTGGRQRKCSNIFFCRFIFAICAHDLTSC